MPGFDGTGPRGGGPLTGKGMGYCVLQETNDSLGHVKGFVGIQGIPVSTRNKNQTAEKGVIPMPFGDGTGPAGFGPMTGRAAGFCAGYPVPGYTNPAVGRYGFYGPIGYGPPYAGWALPWFRGRFGFGRAFGRCRGRGRLGYGW